MSNFLLIIIYIAFISLGLPDSLLGSAWPSMQKELHVPVSYAGMIAMIITGGTIVSSFFSQKVIVKFGTGKVTLVSVLMTALALLGFGMSPSFLWLCILAIPLGLGAGAVDAALNNFVALHYESRHMSWLHCFWGIGATAGPMIMSFYLLEFGGWATGYQTIGIIQVCLVFLLFISLPLWKSKEKISLSDRGAQSGESLKIADILKINGVKSALLGFFCYCALEATAGLWASSFFVIVKNIPPETAAQWVSLFYLGITIGRLVSGFATTKFKNNEMIKIGQKIIAVGVVIIFIPYAQMVLPLGLFIIGVGCAPIYPCMLHNTPVNFGSRLSQAMMGIQMACAYIGAAFMPPFFGLLAEYITMEIYPVYLAMLLIMMMISTRQLEKMIGNK